MRGILVRIAGEHVQLCLNFLLEAERQNFTGVFLRMADVNQLPGGHDGLPVQRFQQFFGRGFQALDDGFTYAG